MSDPEDCRGRSGRRTSPRTDGGAGNGSTPPTPGQPIDVDDARHLDQVRETHDLVLVHFYADWSGPCRLLEPVVARIAGGTEAAVATVDVDANPDLSERADVRGLPTLVLYAEGEPFERRVGVQDEAALRRLIDRYT